MLLTVWLLSLLTRQTRLLVTPFNAVTFFDLLTSKYGPLEGTATLCRFPLKLSTLLSSESCTLIGWTSTFIPVSSNNPLVIDAKLAPPVPGGRYGGTFFSRMSAAASSKNADVFGRSRFCCCRKRVSKGHPETQHNKRMGGRFYQKYAYRLHIHIQWYSNYRNLI